MQQFVPSPSLPTRIDYTVLIPGIVDMSANVSVSCGAAYLATATSWNLHSEASGSVVGQTAISSHRMWLGTPKRFSSAEQIADRLNGHKTSELDSQTTFNSSDDRSETAETLKSQTQQTNNWFQSPVANRGGHEG